MSARTAFKYAIVSATAIVAGFVAGGALDKSTVSIIADAYLLIAIPMLVIQLAGKR